MPIHGDKTPVGRGFLRLKRLADAEGGREGSTGPEIEDARTMRRVRFSSSENQKTPLFAGSVGPSCKVQEQG